MEEINKFKSRKEWKNFVWLKILRKIKYTKSEKELKNLLDNFLSAYEKEIIIKRASALFLIKQGKTYREIGELLWISPRTISSIKQNVKGRQSYQSRREFDEKRSRKNKKNKMIGRGGYRYRMR